MNQSGRPICDAWAKEVVDVDGQPGRRQCRNHALKGRRFCAYHAKKKAKPGEGA